MSEDQGRDEDKSRNKGTVTFNPSSGRPITLRVSEKSGLAIYGLGRFPVTLYKEEWLRLLDLSNEIRSFIGSNSTVLKTRAELEASSISLPEDIDAEGD